MCETSFFYIPCSVSGVDFKHSPACPGLFCQVTVGIFNLIMAIFIDNAGSPGDCQV